MKKVILLFAALTEIALLTACGAEKKKSASSSVTEAGVTTTYAATDTSIATTSVTTTTTITTTTSETTASSEATAATEPKVYAHRFEIMNTAFGTRLESKMSDKEMYALLDRFSVDKDNRYLFACVTYGNEEKEMPMQYFALYRIDLETEEVLFCGETYDVWGEFASPKLHSQELHGLFALGEKAVLATYSGLFVGDEVNHKLVTIADKWDPQAGTAYVSSTRFVASYPREYNTEKGAYDLNVYDYDAVTNTVTIRDDFPENFDGRLSGEILLGRSDNMRDTAEGEKVGEQKIIYEWN